MIPRALISFQVFRGIDQKEDTWSRAAGRRALGQKDPKPTRALANADLAADTFNASLIQHLTTTCHLVRD